jgi:uncharacterized protein YbcI
MTSPAGGQLNQAIAKSVTHAFRQLIGRGPPKAQAFYHGNVIVVLLEDALTVNEHTLIAGGREDLVHSTRRQWHQAIAPKLVGDVEALTEASVEAFMSTIHIAPDLAAELFVLDRPVGGEERRSD